jgi:hypothetical protein
MSEAEPWSYHVDGSPVYSLADIAEAVRHHPGRATGLARTASGKLQPSGS